MLPEREPAAAPFWGYLDLLIFLGLAVAGLFATMLLLGALVRMMPGLRPNVTLIALPAQLILYVVLYLGLWGIIKLKYDRPLWPSLGWVRSRIPNWQSFLFGCVLSVVIGILGTALRTPQVKSPFDRFLHSPVWLILFGIFAVFVGPFFEEVVFRGFIQPLLTRDTGNIAGILLTAGAFGLLHAPEYSGAWQYVILITFAGACFGWLRVRAQSLVPPFFMHAGFNAIFFVAALVQYRIQK